MCARSGANCGSLFLDLRFRELVRTLLVDHPAHLDAASLAYFMHAFSETEKLTYRGEIDDGKQEPDSPPPLRRLTALPPSSHPFFLFSFPRLYVQLYVLQRGRPERPSGWLVQRRAFYSGKPSTSRSV
jgi:hypothetical protein